MRYFWDFVDFIVMMELKTLDTIARNYAIECTYAGKAISPVLTNDFVRMGLSRMGLLVRNDTVHTAFGDVVAALRGINCHLNEVFIAAYLGQFYNYHRLKTGELKTWKLRTRSN